jgi:hypothetical protein
MFHDAPTVRSKLDLVVFLNVGIDHSALRHLLRERPRWPDKMQNGRDEDRLKWTT